MVFMAWLPCVRPLTKSSRRLQNANNRGLQVPDENWDALDDIQAPDVSREQLEKIAWIRVAREIIRGLSPRRDRSVRCEAHFAPSGDQQSRRLINCAYTRLNNSSEPDRGLAYFSRDMRVPTLNEPDT